MNASSKRSNPIGLLSDIKKRRSDIFWVLFVEIVFIGIPFFILSRDEMLTSQILWVLSFQPGETVQESWTVKDFQGTDAIPSGSEYEPSDAAWATEADKVTSPKSYGRKLDGVKEGRWMFWYPGRILKVYKKHIYGVNIYPDSFEGFGSTPGPLQAVGYFKGGRRDGWWKFYNVDGSLDATRTGFYENDIIVKAGETRLLIPGMVLALLMLPFINLQLVKGANWLEKVSKAR